MITKKEIITISRDDRMFKLYDGFFTKENGWTKEECTVSVTYTRIESISAEVKK